MPDIGKVLKDEIRRLSLRSARPLLARVKKDLAKLKHSLAALRRENLRLERDCNALRLQLRGELSAKPRKASGVRIGPKLLLAQRRRLALSRKEFAQLLGASAGAVISWESGRSRPRENVKAALAQVRAMGKRQARERLRLLGKS